MSCKRCNGKTVVETEFTETGEVDCLRCINCGDRSEVIDDRRIKFNKQGEEQ